MDMKKKLIGIGIIAIAVIAFVWWGIPAMTVKKESVSHQTEKKEAAGSVIANDASELAVAKSGDVTLYLDPATLKIRVTDKKAGSEWRSYMNGTDKGAENALLSVSYLGEDNNLYEWNTYTNCAQLDTYEITQLENGVKISMDINEGNSDRFYEYLPKKMSIEEYEEFFVGGLEKAVKDGEITQAECDRYKTTLSLVYRKSIKEECYAVTYTGNPPVSATKQMIAVAKIVGYTSEMLEEDAKTFSFSVNKAEVAEFIINLYLTLEDGELVVELPTEEMQTFNPYYTIQNIKVLPNFGAVTAAQMEEGYLFVPDGSGALMKMNTYQAGVPDYKRPVYDNDYFKDYYFMPEYSEELMMPVYGMTHGGLENAKQAYLAVIESGAETAYIHTMLAGNGTDGAANNKIFSSFDVDQYTNVKVYGPYSEETATFLVDTEAMRMNYKVRYLFFGKKSTYYDMAAAYREYLQKTEGIKTAYRAGEGRVYLDVIGSLTIKDRILGIPYDRTISMTGYSGLEKMLKSLEGVPATVSYEGVFNGGLDNKLNNAAKLVSGNGSKKELQSLMEYAKSRGTDIYYGVNLSRVYDGGNGYRTSIHAVKDYSNEAATVYRYNVGKGTLAGMKNRYANYYEIVSPYYLSGVTEAFLKKAGEYENLYIADLGNLYYADYDNSDMITPFEAADTLKTNLETLAAQKTLVLDNPFMKNIRYGKVASSVSRESSNYTTFAYTIPFRQLVMNGLIEYTTKDINMSSKSINHYVLQAVELGALPKFTVTEKAEDILRNTNYSHLYAVGFDGQKDDIQKVWQICDDAWKKIGTNEITGHRILAKDVFETTYASGVKAVVNYNLTDVTLEDGTVLAAESWQLLDGKGEILP